MDLLVYQQLCVKDITGNIDENEKIILNKWLAESGKNKTEYEKLKSIWDNSLPEEILQIPDIDMEWEVLNNKIQLHNDKHTDRIPGKIKSFIQSVRFPVLKPAFAIGFAALLLITGIFILKGKNNTVTTVMTTISTTGNEQKTVALPDGSVAVLNHNSSVKFPDKFNGKIREVNLTGEAFFSVMKNKIPFVVSTLNAKTTVLGTKFNVWARDGKTEVFVKEGHVKLSQNITNTNGVDLLKGQTSTIVNNNLPTKPRKLNTDYLSGWVDGKLNFNQTPLSEVLGELERFYNVKLVLKDNILKTQTLTGSFKKQDIDSVISMICLTMDLKFEKNNDGYIIKSNN